MTIEERLTKLEDVLISKSYITAEEIGRIQIPKPIPTMLQNKLEKLNGIFCKVHWKGRLVPDAKVIASNKHVSTLMVNVDWKDFEPRKGEYNWRLYDEVLNLAVEYDKNITIGLTPGANSPEWVQKVAGVESKNVTIGGKNYNLPNPVNNIYLDLYLETMRSLGYIYRQHHRVVRASISGPIYLFNEMHIPNGIKVSDEYKQEFLEAWEYCFSHIAQYFLDTPVTTALVPLQGNVQVISNFMHDMIEEHKEQCVFQCDNIADKWLEAPETSPLIMLYEEIRKLPIQIKRGFEVGEFHMSDGPAHGVPINEQNPTAYKQTLDWCKDLGASFVQVNSQRLFNPKNSQAFEMFRKEGQI